MQNPMSRSEFLIAQELLGLTNEAMATFLGVVTKTVEAYRRPEGRPGSLNIRSIYRAKIENELRKKCKKREYQKRIEERESSLTVEDLIVGNTYTGKVDGDPERKIIRLNQDTVFFQEHGDSRILTLVQDEFLSWAYEAAIEQKAATA